MHFYLLHSTLRPTAMRHSVLPPPSTVAKEALWPNESPLHSKNIKNIKFEYEIADQRENPFLHILQQWAKTFFANLDDTNSIGHRCGHFTWKCAFSTFQLFLESFALNFRTKYWNCKYKNNPLDCLHFWSLMSNSHFTTKAQVLVPEGIIIQIREWMSVYLFINIWTRIPYMLLILHHRLWWPKLLGRMLKIYCIFSSLKIYKIRYYLF